MKSSYVGLFLFCCAVLNADTVRIYNKADRPVSYAIYTVKGTGTRVGKVATVQSGEIQTANRPDRKLGTDRELLFTTDPAQLKATLSKNELKNVPRLNIGNLQGKHFYIGPNGPLKGYTELEWKVVEPTLKLVKKTVKGIEGIPGQIKSTADGVYVTISEPAKKEIAKIVDPQRTSPYVSKKASVRVSNDLSPQEKNAIANRTAHVKNALQKELGQSIGYVPKIAMVASGGGYRAMILTLGFLSGAQRSGILDATTWIAGLSGSTWAVGTWMTYGHYRQRDAYLPVPQFVDQFFPRISGKTLATISGNELKLISDALLLRVYAGQPMTLVNLYGVLLANRLFDVLGNKRQQVYLSDQMNLAQSGAWPIPIYTAVQPKKTYNWFEFTPWEVGSSSLSMYIPSWSYGRAFNNGSSGDFGIGTAFGFDLGTYGSAFAVAVEEIWREIKPDIKQPLIKEIVEKILETKISQTIGQQRLSWAAVNNFTKGMAQSPIAQEKIIKLVDAGLAFNLPYPPVSGQRPGRTPDIIIFLDASYDVGAATSQLHKVEEYARAHNLPFPQIDYTRIDKRAMSIFKDDNPIVPVVIYMPRVADPEIEDKLMGADLQRFMQKVKGFDIEACVRGAHCDTFNFDYKTQQLYQISSLAEFNMIANAPRIKDEIREVIKKKSGVQVKVNTGKGKK